MAKLFFILICLPILIFDTAEAESFTCSYDFYGFPPLSDLYYCWVQNSLGIKSRDAAFINSVSGTHQSGYSNSYVHAIWMSGGTMQYFPSGLSTVYPNLKALYMEYCQLKDIRQSEMSPLTQLVSLKLNSNQIEVLVEGLFDYNLKLQYISLHSNKITQIGPMVFNKLTSLMYLNLGSNICINKNAENSATGVKEVIEFARTNCTNFAFANVMQKLDSLKIESINLNSENFEVKISILESEMKGLKLETFSELQAKLTELKNMLTQKIASETITEAPKPKTTTSETTMKPELCPKATEPDSCYALKSKILVYSKRLKTLTAQIQSLTGSESFVEEQPECLRIENKIKELEDKFDEKFNKIIKALRIDE